MLAKEDHFISMEDIVRVKRIIITCSIITLNLFFTVYYILGLDNCAEFLTIIL